MFTVVLNNSETVPTDLEGPPKIFYGRVRSFDNSGNEGEWTSLAASQPTLIDSAEISNLTASKIKAGTITSSVITLDGANSVIKSSTFDGTDVGGGSYSNATTGWLINGTGRAYFYDATIAGSIDIGGFDSGSFHVDTQGNMWLGSGTFVGAPFKVTKEGNVTAATITTGTLALTGNTTVARWKTVSWQWQLQQYGHPLLRRQCVTVLSRQQVDLGRNKPHGSGNVETAGWFKSS